MYQFCKLRGLRELWGYAWASWYAPEKWKLWARSTSDLIFRLRTTMNAENHWRQVKHNHLHHLIRPRLDQLIWILVTKVFPQYVATSAVLEDTYRLGRSKALSSPQQLFKREWKRLAKLEMSGNVDYKPDVGRWLCGCGQQKYNAHLLCKHLVQAVPTPSIAFWRRVVRRRRAPFYVDIELRAKRPQLEDESNEDSDDLEDDGNYYADRTSGSITDGDDHTWDGSATLLRGDGGWRALLNGDVASSNGSLGKRMRDGDENGSHDADTGQLQDGLAALAGSNASLEAGSNPYLENEGEDELNEGILLLEEWSRDLRKAADVIDRQLPFKNSIWINSMVRQGLGKAASSLVSDIRWAESTGRTRLPTWGQSTRERHRQANLMGYHFAAGSET
ncbi:hypothetical protein SCHPADRAFT_883687 [Schizopora paradoxa]|uniref:SWIM-type domain-containing protein n=1 Tax=Schizopora paradoxa TaxID=27342 RepID=A0A0H2R2M5_9AGAM|nr:hypothetical protein SCHPADRAFT_883687 [Schizopora paradoxa]